jgi:hypothetical protein
MCLPLNGLVRRRVYTSSPVLLKARVDACVFAWQVAMITVPPEAAYGVQGFSAWGALQMFFLACQFCFPSALSTSVRVCRQLPLSRSRLFSRSRFHVRYLTFHVWFREPVPTALLVHV